MGSKTATLNSAKLQPSQCKAPCLKAMKAKSQESHGAWGVVGALIGMMTINNGTGRGADQ